MNRGNMRYHHGWTPPIKSSSNGYCRYCGKFFVTASPRQQYCSAECCRLAAAKRRQAVRVQSKPASPEQVGKLLDWIFDGEK